jgi:hypothetical protein
LVTENLLQGSLTQIDGRMDWWPMGWLLKMCRAFGCKICILFQNIFYSVIARWPSSKLFSVLYVWTLQHCIVFNYGVGRLLRIVLLLYHLEGFHALTSGSGPSDRTSMGFAATPDGMLYVFGGNGGSGTEGGSAGVIGLHGASCA